MAGEAAGFVVRTCRSVGAVPKRVRRGSLSLVRSKTSGCKTLAKHEGFCARSSLRPLRAHARLETLWSRITRAASQYAQKERSARAQKQRAQIPAGRIRAASGRLRACGACQLPRNTAASRAAQPAQQKPAPQIQKHGDALHKAIKISGFQSPSASKIAIEPFSAGHNALVGGTAPASRISSTRSSSVC